MTSAVQICKWGGNWVAEVSTEILRVVWVSSSHKHPLIRQCVKLWDWSQTCNEKPGCSTGEELRKLWKGTTGREQKLPGTPCGVQQVRFQWSIPKPLGLTLLARHNCALCSGRQSLRIRIWRVLCWDTDFPYSPQIAPMWKWNIDATLSFLEDMWFIIGFHRGSQPFSQRLLIYNLDVS